MATTCPPAAAQAQDGPQPAEEAPCSTVLHVWVDPQYGVDGSLASPLASFNALRWNPGPDLNPGWACNPTSDRHPLNVVDSAGNVLLHAPGPFRTVTAAVAYIEQITVSIGGPGARLPVTMPDSQVTCEYAIIHCLPGLYTNAPATYRDPHSLEPGNGETFPIQLPNRVSIQGTSALNTLFVLNRETQATQSATGPIFEFGADANNIGRQDAGSVTDPAPGLLSGSFIDSVSITGVILRRESTSGISEEQAAIHIHPTSGVQDGAARRSLVQISNSFIYGNGIGVLIDCDASPLDLDERHVVRLINNTFAWNLCGVWNGNTTPVVSPNFASAIVQAVNNVFDASPPLADIPDSTSQTSDAGLPYFVEVQGQRNCPGGTQRPEPARWERWRDALNSKIPEPGGANTRQNNLAQGMTAFEGLGRSALQLLIGGNTTVTPNAFEYDTGLNVRKYNSFDGLVQPLPAPTLTADLHGLWLKLPETRSPDPLQNPPTNFINLAPFTGGVSNVPFDESGGSVIHREPDKRGIVFIRDIFHEGVRDGGSGQARLSDLDLDCGNDLSLEDFRLAPTVSNAARRWDPLLPGPVASAPISPADMVTPLADIGFVADYTAGQSLQFMPIQTSPTTLSGHSLHTFNPLELASSSCSSGQPGAWDHSPWDYDAEGFGNPREADAPWAANNAFQDSFCDFGADEIGGQVIAGMRSGTTTFLGFEGNALILSQLLPFGAYPDGIQQQRVWILGVPQDLTTANPDPSGSGVSLLPAFIELGEANAYTFGPSAGGWYFPPHVETTPYLLPDVHPYWTPIPTSPGTTGTGSIPANIIWQTCPSVSFGPGTAPNPFLYQPPLTGIANASGLGTFDPLTTNSPAWLALQGSSGPAAAPIAAQILDPGLPGSGMVPGWIHAGVHSTGGWPLYLSGAVVPNSGAAPPPGSVVSFELSSDSRFVASPNKLSCFRFSSDAADASLFPYIFGQAGFWNAQSSKLVTDTRTSGN